MTAFCSDEGKLAYPSRLAAEAVIVDMRSTDIRGDLLAAYSCGPRPHWHVGHNDPGGRRPRPGARPRPVIPEHLTYHPVLPDHLLALLDHDEERACG